MNSRFSCSKFSVTTRNKALKTYNYLDAEMRKQNKIILWPVYFDSTKTRLEGRRVPKSLAAPSPKLEEILKAVERMGLRPEIVADAAHPSSPWQKNGLLAIPKKGSKVETLRKIAKELLNIRGQT
jgi:signal recognition particle subunit SRP19